MNFEPDDRFEGSLRGYGRAYRTGHTRVIINGAFPLGGASFFGNGHLLHRNLEVHQLFPFGVVHASYVDMRPCQRRGNIPDIEEKKS